MSEGGRVDADVELDRKILEWHEARPGTPGFGILLSEHLGMSPAEYEAWVIRT